MIYSYRKKLTFNFPAVVYVSMGMAKQSEKTNIVIYSKYVFKSS